MFVMMVVYCSGRMAMSRLFSDDDYPAMEMVGFVTEECSRKPLWRRCDAIVYVVWGECVAVGDPLAESKIPFFSTESKGSYDL